MQKHTTDMNAEIPTHLKEYWTMSKRKARTEWAQHGTLADSASEPLPNIHWNGTKRISIQFLRSFPCLVMNRGTSVSSTAY